MSSSNYQEITKWKNMSAPYVDMNQKQEIPSGDSTGYAFEDIPDDWVCPVCGVTKSNLNWERKQQFPGSISS